MADEITYNIDVTYIEVPDYNDSFLLFKYNGKSYNLRFTWNDLLGRWMFGVYDNLKEPIMTGVLVVPGICLNLFTNSDDLIGVVFSAESEYETIGRDSFKNGTAKFVFVPVPEEAMNG